MAIRNELRQLARIVLLPSAEPITISTYQSLIIDCFLARKPGDVISPADVVSHAGERFLLRSVPEPLVEEAFSALARENRAIQVRPGLWRLQDNVRDHLLASVEESKKKYDQMLEYFFGKVRVFYKDFDRYHRAQLVKYFENLLKEIIEEIGSLVMDFLNGEAKTEIPDERIRAIFARQREEMNDNRLAYAFQEAFRECLNYPTPSFANGFFVLASRYVMFTILGADPATRKIKLETVRGTRIILDTNVIVSLLCTGSLDHKATKTIIDLTRDLGIEVSILDATIGEFDGAIDHADELYREWQDGQIFLEHEDNEIIKTYRESADIIGDWGTYLLMLRQGVETLERRYEVKVVDTSELVIPRGQFRRAQAAIYDSLVRSGKRPHYHNILHDAQAILLIHKLRAMEGNKGLSSYWFLTRHQRLHEPDYAIKKSVVRAEFPATISLEVWLQVIRPFLGPGVDEKDLSESFSRMVAGSLLPLLPPISVKAFVSYVSPMLGVQREDEDYIVRLIQKHPLQKNLLEKVNARKTLEALDVLVEIIETPVDNEKRNAQLEEVVERQKRVIQDLRAKTKETGGVVIRAAGDVNYVAASYAVSASADHGAVAIAGAGESSISVEKVHELFTAVRRLAPETGPEIASFEKDFKRAGSNEEQRSVLTRFKEWLEKRKDTIIGASALLLQLTELLRGGIG